MHIKLPILGDLCHARPFDHLCLLCSERLQTFRLNDPRTRHRLILDSSEFDLCNFQRASLYMVWCPRQAAVQICIWGTSPHANFDSKFDVFDCVKQDILHDCGLSSPFLCRRTFRSLSKCRQANLWKTSYIPLRMDDDRDRNCLTFNWGPYSISVRRRISHNVLHHRGWKPGFVDLTDFRFWVKKVWARLDINLYRYGWIATKSTFDLWA